MIDNNSNQETLEQKAIRGLNHEISRMKDEVAEASHYVSAGQAAYEIASLPSPVVVSKEQ